MAVMDFSILFFFSSQNMRSVERRGRISRGWGFSCIWPMVERYVGNCLKVVLQWWRRLAKKGLHFSFYDWQFSIFQKAKVCFFFFKKKKVCRHMLNIYHGEWATCIFWAVGYMFFKCNHVLDMSKISLISLYFGLW